MPSGAYIELDYADRRQDVVAAERQNDATSQPSRRRPEVTPVVSGLDALEREDYDEDESRQPHDVSDEASQHRVWIDRAGRDHCRKRRMRYRAERTQSQS